MPLTLAVALALASQCAPEVAPETLLSVVQVESRFNPLAVGINGTPRLTSAPLSLQDAISKAQTLIAAGRSVDLGLGQINSRNLGWLGLSLPQAFEPCANLAAAARVLRAGYARNAVTGDDQAALRRALSLYNTGNPERGIQNGYVAKVASAATVVVPAIEVAETAPTVRSPPSLEAAIRPRQPPPAWDVFGQSTVGRRFVLHIAAQPEGASK